METANTKLFFPACTKCRGILELSLNDLDSPVTCPSCKTVFDATYEDNGLDDEDNDAIFVTLKVGERWHG